MLSVFSYHLNQEKSCLERKVSCGLLCVWILQFIELAAFLWCLKSAVVKLRYSMPCVLLTSGFDRSSQCLNLPTGTLWCGKQI